MRVLYKKVLIIGSGAIKIGQAGEFDYSGSQAIKALKEEGIFTVLINPNIATVQTSENFADKVYFLPITAKFVEEVIEKERPQGVILGFGGQTALNVGIELWDSGVFKKHGVAVLGTGVESIKKTEDRKLFSEEIISAGLKTPYSFAVHTVDEAMDAAEKIGYPVMVRLAFTLGGLGSGIVQNSQDLRGFAQKAFQSAKQILIEECLKGWKEVEYEVVRDRHNNCIVVCSMENFDPMGIHTGESIVVAPVQTLTSKENFMLRSIAIKTIRHFNIVGECNIQYALNPENGDYRIIEINPRLSRSSALASKATGYPLAYIAAKLSLGLDLTEIRNCVTMVTKACFEPALDYIVVKYPRWDLQKFKNVQQQLGSEMKSVGEVMSIGRSFEEAIQKAIRMLDLGNKGLTGQKNSFKDLEKELIEPTDKRIFAIVEAFEKGYTIKQIHQLTKITEWFLAKIENVVKLEKEILAKRLDTISIQLLKKAKQLGFSDLRLGELLGKDEAVIRNFRKVQKILPKIKQIDTLAGEFPSVTNYLYMTYNAEYNDIESEERDKVIILGGGPYKIGSSVEFDWCCVNSALALNKMDYQSIMINNNPETVSTDYDLCGKLYFEELTSERVLDIYEFENPLGVIVAMGGQIPNNLVMPLHKNQVRFIGTKPEFIDQAENRHLFSSLLDTLKIDQPEWKELTTLAEAKLFSTKVGYPVLIRPSYVLSGAAMAIADSEEELEFYLQKASEINKEHPVVITKFIVNAKEIELDGVANNGELYTYAISEHIENAGVHSGDATLVLPPQRTYLETLRRIKKITQQVVKALNITGPFNIQFIAKNNDVSVIECNLRASRSFPFVSKVFDLNFIEIATKLMMGKKLPAVDKSCFELDYVGVKAPQFSFIRLKGSDPVLGVEMASTGEVGCIGRDMYEAFLKSMLSVGLELPKKAVLISSGPLENKIELLNAVKKLSEMGLKLFATGGSADFLQDKGLEVTSVNWPNDQMDNKHLSALDLIEQHIVDLVINIPKNSTKGELDNNYLIRRKAIDFNIPLITNTKIARTLIEAIYRGKDKELEIKSWDEYINQQS